MEIHIFAFLSKIMECLILMSTSDIIGVFTIYSVSMIEITGLLFMVYYKMLIENKYALYSVIKTLKFVLYIRISKLFKMLAFKQ